MLPCCAIRLCLAALPEADEQELDEQELDELERTSSTASEGSESARMSIYNGWGQ